MPGFYPGLTASTPLRDLIRSGFQRGENALRRPASLFRSGVSSDERKGIRQIFLLQVARPALSSS